MLDTCDQTNIPKLRKHVDDTCAGFGIEAQAAAHHRRIEHVLNEIEGKLLQQKTLLDQKLKLSGRKRKEVDEAFDGLYNFLGQSLRDHRESFGQDLIAGQDLLGERLKLAIDRGRAELETVCQRWSLFHWATLRAVARRGGVFCSPTFGYLDFPGDAAKPILDGIAFTWSDFFGEKLVQTLERWNDRLILLAERHGRELLKTISSIGGIRLGTIHDDLAQVIQVTQKVLKELLDQVQVEMRQRIEDVRRTLYEEIPGKIAAEMRPAFLRASHESGTGMKARMIGIISRHTREVSDRMFLDAEDAINEGVCSLVDWLTQGFGEMTKAVQENSQTLRDNLVGPKDMPTEELDRQRRAVAAVRDVFHALRSDSVMCPRLLGA